MHDTNQPVIDYSVYGNNPIPSIDTWKSFVEGQSSVTAPMRYIDATVDMLKKIELLTKLDNLQELKSELTKLFEERRDFVVFALDSTI